MKKYPLFNLLLTAVLTVFVGSAMAKGQNLLDETHFDKGIKCASCHGDAQPRQAVNMLTCTKCHNTQSLAKKTKDVKPTNPHENRHFGTETDCSNCHHIHQKSDNYCAGCHARFDFKVP
ncbi:cytochrome c3 family protein [Shewanella avicenniae]|uniref:Cytochrome c3 family protein n=1 Tax=Shewanella avicenniae TaxID=2814294 RepID=A0ABX7QS84_9GAMM|nr:cytochrome c3 family protein [Shewanella avicenniae]QSX34317.1 cytochrome c3 family protein [Shewanella avicenniae]